MSAKVFNRIYMQKRGMLRAYESSTRLGITTQMQREWYTITSQVDFFPSKPREKLGHIFSSVHQLSCGIKAIAMERDENTNLFLLFRSLRFWQWGFQFFSARQVLRHLMNRRKEILVARAYMGMGQALPSFRKILAHTINRKPFFNGLHTSLRGERKLITNSSKTRARRDCASHGITQRNRLKLSSKFDLPELRLYAVLCRRIVARTFAHPNAQ